MKEIVNAALRHARKLIVGTVGITILMIGISMVVLPGPALVVIPIGLAVLGSEFLWARRLLNRVRSKAADAVRILKPDEAYAKNDHRDA